MNYDFIYNTVRKKNITLISDEIYHGIEYDNFVTSMLNFGKRCHSRK